MGLEIGSIVMTEYGHVGKIVAAYYPNEAVVEIFNYGIVGDQEYCVWDKLEKATKQEVLDAIKEGEFYKSKQY